MSGKTPILWVVSVIVAYYVVVVGEALGISREFGTGAAAVPGECTLSKWELNNGAKFILPDGTSRLVIQNAGGSYSSPIRCYFDEDGRWKLCSVLCGSEKYEDEAACKEYYCPVYNDCHKVPQAQGLAELCAGAFPGEFTYTKPPPDILKRPIKDTELKRAVPVVDNAGGDKSNGGMPTLATVGLSVVGAVLVVLGAVGAVVARRRSQANNAPPRGNDVELGDGAGERLQGEAADTDPAGPGNVQDAAVRTDDHDIDSFLWNDPNPSGEVHNKLESLVPPDLPNLQQDDSRASTSGV